MISVLHIISDTNIGGAGRVLLNYLRFAHRAQFHIAVALPRGSALIPPLQTLDAQVLEVDGIADRSFDLQAIRRLRQLIRTHDPDIVHTHGALSGRIAGKQCGKKVVFTRHSAFPVPAYLKRGPGHWLSRFLNRRYADAIIAVSPATAENLVELGTEPGRIDTIMNGVEAVPRSGEAECAALRERYGIRPGDFTVGILARIEDYKGHTDILQALRLLRDEGLQLRLLVAGTGSYEAQVRDTCRALGLEDSVVFLGFVQDVAPILSLLDVQLNASWGTEATSLSLLEGFSMGLPAVISDYGGNPYLIDQGVNGYLFPARDPAALAARLRPLLEDPALLARLSAGAEQIYRARFTGEAFARHTEELYRRMVQ